MGLAGRLGSINPGTPKLTEKPVSSKFSVIFISTNTWQQDQKFQMPILKTNLNSICLHTVKSCLLSKGPNTWSSHWCSRKWGFPPKQNHCHLASSSTRPRRWRKQEQRGSSTAGTSPRRQGRKEVSPISIQSYAFTSFSFFQGTKLFAVMSKDWAWVLVCILSSR